MPDELAALRQFRDETPGPSTDAWNRARAAIATAKAEEEPTRRQYRWMPGRHLPGPGRRRAMWTVTVGAVAAATAGLLAVLLPGSPASRGTEAQVETTAFVSHVEHALSESGRRNVVGYARTVYPPDTSVEPMSPGAVRVLAGRGAGSPWSVGYLVRWSYQGTMKISAFTAGGQRVFDVRTAPAGGLLTSTAVLYRSRTWWRGATGPVSVGNRPASAGTGPAPARCGPGIQIGPGGWPAFLSHALSCGEYVKGSHRRVGGIDAIELTGTGGTVIWVNPDTYLPVRATLTIPGGARIQTDFGWFTPTRARLAQLHLSVPPGFRQVPPP